MYLLDDLRCNNLARTTPCGETVEDHETFLVQRLVKFLLRAEIVNASFGHGC